MQILGQNQIKQSLHKQRRCCDLKKNLLNPQAFHMLAMEMEHAWPLRMEVSTLLCFCDTKSRDFIIDWVGTVYSVLILTVNRLCN